MNSFNLPYLGSGKYDRKVFIPDFLSHDTLEGNYKWSEERGMYNPIGIPIQDLFDKFGRDYWDVLESNFIIFRPNGKPYRNLEFLVALTHGNKLLKREEFIEMANLKTRSENDILNRPEDLMKTRVSFINKAFKKNLKINPISGYGFFLGSRENCRRGLISLPINYMGESINNKIKSGMYYNLDSLVYSFFGNKITLTKNEFISLNQSLVKIQEHDNLNAKHLSHARKKFKEIGFTLKMQSKNSLQKFEIYEPRFSELYKLI